MTAKPWKIEKSPKGNAYCIYYDEYLVAQCNYRKGDKDGEKKAYEIAQRLAASANACEDIPIETLERNGFKRREL